MCLKGPLARFITFSTQAVSLGWYAVGVCLSLVLAKYATPVGGSHRPCRKGLAASVKLMSAAARTYGPVLQGMYLPGDSAVLSSIHLASLPLCQGLLDPPRVTC